jgi:hypothetical protein
MRDRRPTSWLVRLGIVATAGALAFAAFGVPHSGGPDDHGSLAGTPSRTAPGTTFKIASFNVLGAVHTDTGQRPGWAKSSQRMAWAVRLIDQNQLQVVGFQEFEATQYDRFKQLTGTRFGVYPGVKLGRRASVQNSIAWRRDTWRLVEAHTIRVPYFHGTRLQMPYVLLQNLATGENVWFYNSHNPADTHGRAGKWRREGYRIEAALVARLRAADPSTAVVVTGDKNAREPYFCYMAQHSILHSANGGSWSNDRCTQPPAPLAIDWVLGTSDVRFDSYIAFRDDLVRKTTDHPIVMANATIAPRTPPIADHVVVLAVQGLRSVAVNHAVEAGVAPALADLRSRGAFTMNARSEVERTSRAANVIGMLTGRPVNPARDGHGVGWRTASPSTTVHEAAGHYVSSVYDVVHDYGYPTSFLANGTDLGIVDRSWGPGDGRADRYGTDNGRNKISHYAMLPTDGKVARALVGELSGGTAPTLAVAHLARPGRVGQRYGWHSPEYTSAITGVSGLVGWVQRTIDKTPGLAGRTLLVVTADSGADGTKDSANSAVSDYRIPFFATGPSVPAGTRLYSLNPQLSTPGTARVGYAAAQPVRNGFIANLVTTALGMPRVPGSTLDADQSFTVFGPSP